MLEGKSTPTPVKMDGGFYVGKVIGHLDTTYMGSLLVEIQRGTGNNPKSDGSSFVVRYAPPFFGSTSLSHNSMGDDYDSTQKSYGFWAVPPDKDTLVLCTFIEGDPTRGFWIACVPDSYMNFMVPGTPAMSGEDGIKVPVAEYNKKLNTVETSDPSTIKKPKHLFADVLARQGLLGDEFRGITTSGARRELPSAVFGWSTPGPIDKRQGAPRGAIGRKETSVDSAFVSRLGGSSFVMDDGDDKILRTGDPFDTPPAFVNVEAGEEGGDVTRPHNELVRIRTRTGHQLLFHNTEDFIYIANSKGTAWVELTSRGKIDVYANESISYHTNGDFNVTAGGKVNISGESINLKSKSHINAESKTDINILADNLKIQSASDISVSSNGHIKVRGVTTSIKVDDKIVLNADGVIGIKSQKATMSAESVGISGGNFSVATSSVSFNGSIPVDSPPAPNTPEIPEPANVPSRVPMAEPWLGHENLNPLGADDVPLPVIPDTFRKGK